MAYQALYRKYRPKTFSDVKGQEAIVTTLKNQLKSDRVGHAYLFCGTRGTGKTTVAKILAKAMNCENLTDDGPCGECARCQSIEDGSSMNVIEIDGASNNGVADVRQIVDEVNYAPIDGGRKVYIIDEAHMLTENAFNALLKTLEEPPSYLTFILATTDPQKIIPTIQSRCQRYDFKRIPVQTITDRLRELLDQEGVEAEDRALTYIARVADGALRDALSLLEECISYYFKEALTFDKVLNVVGSVDQTVYHTMTQALIEGEVTRVVGTVDELVSTGRDLTQFAKEYIWYLRNLLMVKSSKDVEQLVDLSNENISILRDYASKLEEEQIIRYIHVMSRLVADMRHSANRRVEFEIALVRLCHPQMERDYDSLVDRMKTMERDLEKLQDRLEAGVYATAAPAPAAPAAAGATAAPTPPPALKKLLPEAVPDEVKEIVAQWKHVEQTILAKGQGLIGVNLEGVVLSVDDNGCLVLGFREPVALRYFRDDKENLETLQEIIGEATGKQVRLVVKDISDARERVAIEDLREILKNIPIEEED
ncbi:MAG: DNA polymerase III subunit gamma/tau [Eubacterium sp.]|nr:DNA polymerase III subunit gamma/tau [Eubacterium sp.]